MEGLTRIVGVIAKPVMCPARVLLLPIFSQQSTFPACDQIVLPICAQRNIMGVHKTVHWEKPMTIALQKNTFIGKPFFENLRRVGVVSTGTHFPDETVSSKHLLAECNATELYGISENFLKRGLGIDRVHRAAAGALPSDMAIPAAQMALDDAPQVNKNHIDMVIFCGMDRDGSEPGTAHTLNDKLGLSACETMDISDACLGFVRGIISASRAISLGHVRYALVATGEISSRIVNDQIKKLKAGIPRAEAKTRLGILSAGDAGSAVILGPMSIGSSAGFGSFFSATNSKDRDKCYYRYKEDGSIDARMKMDELFESGSTLMLECLRRHPAPVDTAFVISHQISSGYHRMVENLNIVPKSRVIKSYDQYGNVTTNSFAVNYRQVIEDPRSRPGDTILCMFGGSGTTYCQFDYRL